MRGGFGRLSHSQRISVFKLFQVPARQLLRKLLGGTRIVFSRTSDGQVEFVGRTAIGAILTGKAVVSPTGSNATWTIRLVGEARVA